jgi:hypothetical protein
MSHGARDYYFWDMPISVPNGGTGCTSLTLNGVLIGQGGNGIFVTTAGTANQVLRVPGAGGAPVFSSLGALADKSAADLSSADVSGILPVAHGGTSTNTPALVAGTGISITGTWPAQTINSTSNYATLADPLPIAHGGTGTTTPALIAGTGISISGVWPGQTITNTSAYATLADPLPVAHGGTGTTTPALVAGVGISISGSWPSQTITNTSAYATLGDPLPIAHGGSGTATPSVSAGVGISISGTWAVHTITNTSAYATLADPLAVAHGGTGTASPSLVAGTNISITGSWPNQTISLVNPPIKLGTGGTPNEDAIEIGNSSSPGWTQIGPTVATVSGIAGSLLGLANKSVAWRVAFDLAGNLGLAGTLTLTTPLTVTSGGTGVGTCSAGQILIGSGANAAAFTTPDGCRVYNSAAQSIPNSTQTNLSFNTERYNNGGMHSTISNNSRITAQKAGVYVITGNVEFASNATGMRVVGVILNGATPMAEVRIPAVNGNTTILSVSTLLHMAINDYVELFVYQDSGGALNVTLLADISPEFAAQWMGP